MIELLYMSHRSLHATERLHVCNEVYGVSRNIQLLEQNYSSQLDLADPLRQFQLIISFLYTVLQDGLYMSVPFIVG